MGRMTTISCSLRNPEQGTKDGHHLTRTTWFRTIASIALAAFGLSPSLIAGRPAEVRASDATAAAATPTDCPVTEPNGFLPPIGEHVFGRGPGGHGNDELWTNLWTWGEGVVRVPPTHVQPDGSLGGMKWPWWRGVPGTLTSEGHRLDASAPPPRAGVSGGYGETGFQVSGLIFPTTGCWQVTGNVGDASLTFVVLVERVNTAGTPIAEANVELATPKAGTATPEQE